MAAILCVFGVRRDIAWSVSVVGRRMLVLAVATAMVGKLDPQVLSFSLAGTAFFSFATAAHESRCVL